MKNIKTAIILGSGTYESLEFYKEFIENHPKAFIIAVDGGYDFLNEVGIKADLLIGDLDSIKDPVSDLIRVIKVNPVKDETDTRLAIDYLVRNGYKRIYMLGMSSLDRLDHSLVNIFLLEKYAKRGIALVLVNQNNKVFCLRGKKKIKLGKYRHKTISLIPLTKTVKGVSISGVKYPLVKRDLKRDDPDFTVSNEIETGKSELRLKSGSLLVVIVNS